MTLSSFVCSSYQDSVMAAEHATSRDQVAQTSRAPDAKQALAPVSSEPCPRARPGWSGAASLVPGALLHGSGHYVAGCTGVGEKLFWVSLSGLGLVLAAFVPAPVFGAHPYLIPFLAFAGMTGAALFMGSWLFDVYGSLLPPAARGSALNRVASMETQLGYKYVYDPAFEFRHFWVQGFDIWYRGLRLMPRADISPAGYNARYRLPIAWRLLGPTPTLAASDGSFVDVVGAITHHDFSRDGFQADTLELAAEARLDLTRFEPALAGIFTELGAGAGLNRYAYETTGAGHDLNNLLLMSFAFGGYFGDPTRRGGEVKLYYDHRHDDFAAGLKLTGLGSGVVGHFGLGSRAYFHDSWGLLLDAQVGSAVVLNASLLFRQGGTP